MTRAAIESWSRLGIGVTLNVVLWPLMQALARWSNYERDVRLTLATAAFGVVSLAAIVPLFWRGRSWQVPVAFVLVWLPSIAIWLAVSQIVSNL